MYIYLSGTGVGICFAVHQSLCLCCWTIADPRNHISCTAGHLQTHIQVALIVLLQTHIRKCQVNVQCFFLTSQYLSPSHNITQACFVGHLQLPDLHCLRQMRFSRFHMVHMPVSDGVWMGRDVRSQAVTWTSQNPWQSSYIT